MMPAALIPSSSFSFSTKLWMSCEDTLVSSTLICSPEALGDEKPLGLPGADAKRLLEELGSQCAVCSFDLETATLIARPVSLLDRLDAG
jgi:hypothetical protein